MIPSPNNTLSLVAQAVKCLLRGEILMGEVEYEKFGEYHDLIWRLNLLAAIDTREAQNLWFRESGHYPQLEVMVEGSHQEGLVHPSDLIPLMKRWYDHGAPQGVSPGWKSLADNYRVMTGESTVITGTPSAGKSRLLTAILTNIARDEDWKFLLFSPEMSPPQRHLELVLTQYVGKPFRPARPGRMSWAEAEEGLRWIDQHFTWLWPKTQPATIAYITAMAKRESLINGTKGVVIDPWNRVSHARGKNELDTSYIGDCLSQLSASAQTYDYHQFIVAHPTKVFKEGGTFPIITPNMISGSSNFWNMPENILSIRRNLEDDDDHKTEVYIQKTRWDENGRMGRRVDLYYHKETARYSEMQMSFLPRGYR